MLPAPVTLNDAEDKSQSLRTVYADDVFVTAVVTVQPIKSTVPVAAVALITRLDTFRPSMVQPFARVRVPVRVVFLPTCSCVVNTVNCVSMVTFSA